MYTVALKRDFIAQHFLIGGDWGAENELHSHHYQIELQLEGRSLNEHGYLVDIVEIEASMDAAIAEYRDNTLNELSAFKGLNPSMEHFSRILCEVLQERIPALNISAFVVKLWEDEVAWAVYRLER